MELTRTIISFGGSSVLIQHAGAEAAGLVAFLFDHLAPAPGAQPHRVFQLAPAEEGLELELRRDGELISRRPPGAIIAEVLMGEVCHHLVDRSCGGLLFHAAAVAWEDRAIMLAGSAGAGKSTLAGWLSGHGFRYLTDEMVYLPDGAEAVQTFTRPLNLKPPSPQLLAPFLDLNAPKGVLKQDGRVLVSPALLNAQAEFAPLPMGALLFPRYQPGGELELRPLSPGRAGLALMECLVNARNLAGHGLPEAARLARLAPAYRLTYGRFDQLDPLLAVLRPGEDGA